MGFKTDKACMSPPRDFSLPPVSSEEVAEVSFGYTFCKNEGRVDVVVRPIGDCNINYCRYFPSEGTCTLAVSGRTYHGKTVSDIFSRNRGLLRDVNLLHLGALQTVLNNGISKAR